MKGLILTGLLFTQIAYANSNKNIVTCKPKVLTSACGSGDIILELDFEEKKFSYNHGDVNCWFDDAKHEGDLIEVDEPLHLYFDTKSYILVDNFTTIADVHIKNKRSNPYPELAKLKTSSSFQVDPYSGVRDGTYNLSCE